MAKELFINISRNCPQLIKTISQKETLTIKKYVAWSLNFLSNLELIQTLFLQMELLFFINQFKETWFWILVNAYIYWFILKILIWRNNWTCSTFQECLPFTLLLDSIILFLWSYWLKMELILVKRLFKA